LLYRLSYRGVSAVGAAGYQNCQRIATASSGSVLRARSSLLDEDGQIAGPKLDSLAGVRELAQMSDHWKKYGDPGAIPPEVAVDPTEPLAKSADRRKRSYRQ
jgi:hypothetical protein